MHEGALIVHCGAGKGAAQARALPRGRRRVGEGAARVGYGVRGVGAAAGQAPRGRGALVRQFWCGEGARLRLDLRHGA